jgi:protein SCO1/2
MHTHNKISGYLLIILGLLFTGMASAKVDEGGATYDEKAALALSQAVIGQGFGEYTCLDGKGKQVTLESLRGKPVVISLIYTSCYHICPTVTTNLAKVVKIGRDALGNDSFSVLTIGFDTKSDTPDRMRVFAAQRNLDISNWHFLSSDAETMQRLSADVGFSYFSSPKGFDHMIQATVLDGEGKVYRQIYGMAPDAPALVEPLKELLYGKRVDATPIESLVSNIRLFCTVYDPTTGMYRFDYSIFIGFAIGLVSLSGTAWFIIRAWRNSSTARPKV